MSEAGRVPPLDAADYLIIGAGVHGLAPADIRGPALAPAGGVTPAGGWGLAR